MEQVGGTGSLPTHAPNEGIQATANNVRCATASGRGSAAVFGIYRIHQSQPWQGEEGDTHDRDQRL
jgi:hypothetical protein